MPLGTNTLIHEFKYFVTNDPFYETQFIKNYSIPELSFLLFKKVNLQPK